MPAAAADTAKGDAAPSGPARVIVVSHQSIRNGPRAAHIIGEVKNVGGADAEAVGVTLSAIDATQGTPCLNEQMPVSPSTLAPGKTGNFDVDIDNPCLSGDTPVDVTAIWR